MMRPQELAYLTFVLFNVRHYNKASFIQCMKVFILISATGMFPIYSWFVLGIIIDSTLFLYNMPKAKLSENNLSNYLMYRVKYQAA